MSGSVVRRIAPVILAACAAAFHCTPTRAQGLRVTEVFLKADDARPSGPCPLRVVFRGYITADGPGTVEYTFARSDGASAPVFRVEFQGAGSQPVVTDWTLGDARTLPAYEGWQAIKVLSPNPLESSHETGSFSVTCSAGAPGAPKQGDGGEKP